jgi:hypothetical protein
MTVRVSDKLPQFTETIRQRAEVAMTRALIIGQSEAAAITPRHTSVLINSAIRKVDSTDERVVGVAGYTAEYALFVHEASGKLKGQPRPKKGGIPQGNYWDPSGEPQFLKKGFERSADRIQAELVGALK